MRSAQDTLPLPVMVYRWCTPIAKVAQNLCVTVSRLVGAQEFAIKPRLRYYNSSFLAFLGSRYSDLKLDNRGRVELLRRACNNSYVEGGRYASFINTSIIKFRRRQYYCYSAARAVVDDDVM